jgi:hypothetical protein
LFIALEAVCIWSLGDHDRKKNRNEAKHRHLAKQSGDIQTRDDSQLTFLTAISAFGDSTSPFFVSKNKTFEKKRSADFEMQEGHDYMIRAARKTLMTEVVFADWLKTVFLSWVETWRQRMQHQGSVILLLDGYAPTSLPESWRMPVLKELLSFTQIELQCRRLFSPGDEVSYSERRVIPDHLFVE